MKKRVVFGIIVVLVIILLILGLRLTGFATENGEEAVVEVTRLITEDTVERITNVQLKVVSSENVLAIQEFFIGEYCGVLYSFIQPEIDVFEFNDNENIWILANRSDTLVLDLYYIIPIDCKVDRDAGKVYTLNDTEGLEGFGIIGEEEQETPPGSNGGNGGGGGGNGGGGGTPQSLQDLGALQLTPIQQAEDEQDFNEKVQQAIEKISEIETPKRTGWFIIITLILVISLWVIILGGAYFFKKRKIKRK